MMSQPAPFIVGVGRSGTTLLRLMLDAHPDIAIPPETHFISEFLQCDVSGIQKDDFIRILIGYQTWPNFGLSERALREALDNIEPFSVSEAIRRFYGLYRDLHGKPRWGDKTPPYRTCMIGIQKLLPEASFIHVIRDGRDVALSHKGLWFGPGDDIEAQAKFWVEQIHCARSQASALPAYMEIKYEQLVRDPERILRSICDYLDLRFDSRMLEYHWSAAERLEEYRRPFGPPGFPTEVEQFLSIHERVKRPPDVGRVDRWRTEMNCVERQKYEQIAGPLLRMLGYDA